MIDITLSELIEKTLEELESAKARVKSLETRLATLSAVANELEVPAQRVGMRRTIFPGKGTGASNRETTQRSDNLGSAIVAAIESSIGDFSAATIAKELSSKFPDVDEKIIARRASQYVFNYFSKGKIDRVSEGRGNVPSVYRLKQ